MKYLLLALIRTYWSLWPRHLNRGCIYKETCSHHVYWITYNLGFFAGCGALKQRIRTCRPGYAVTTSNGELGLILRDGSFLSQHLVANKILVPIKHTILDFEQRLSNGN